MANTDFIVVGGGTSGCVVAKLLSEHFNVILFEAGESEDDNDFIKTPSFAGSNVTDRKNKFFWGLGNAEKEHLNRVLPETAGRLMGGGSSVSGMLYTRGSNKYFNKLKNHLDDPTWGPDNVTETYKNIENFTSGNVIVDTDDHGYEGPVSVRMGTVNEQASDTFATSFTNITGQSRIVDYNDPVVNTGSFVYSQLTQNQDRTRASSSNSYIGEIGTNGVPVSNNCKSNLTIYRKSTVLKILFNRNKKAVGVKALIQGECSTFFSRKCVIICAGVQSSTLLQISGIGDRDLLEKLKITVIVNNKNVGKKITNAPIINLSGLGFIPGNVVDSQSLYSGGGFLNNPFESDPEQRSSQFIGTELSGFLFIISTILLQTSSTGEISITSKDPLKMPEYSFNHFSEQSDINEGVYVLSIMNLILLNMGLIPLFSGDLEIFLLNNYNKSFVQSGGNIMGKSSEDSVVNSCGEVFGTKCLYVADATIFPFPPDSGTLAPSLLVGTIIANKILKKCGIVFDKHCWTKPGPLKENTKSLNHNKVEKEYKYSHINCFTCNYLEDDYKDQKL